MAVYQGSTVVKRRPKDGKGVLSVTEYYLATNLSEGVTQGTLGWTANPSEAVLTPTNKYLWRYETTIYTDGTSSTTNPVIIGTYGEKGDEGLPGPIVVQKEWVEGDTHRYTDEIKDYIYVRGDSNDTSYWYTLASKGTVTAGVAPTGGTTPNGYVSVNWMKELAVKFLIAEEANLANFIFQNGRLSSEDGLSGLNGVAGSANNNPVLWAGGTYDDALSGTAKAIIRHDGSVKFTEAEITGTITSNSSGNRIVIDASNRSFAMIEGTTSKKIFEMSFNEGVVYPHMWIKSSATGQSVGHITNAFVNFTDNETYSLRDVESNLSNGFLFLKKISRNLYFDVNVIASSHLIITAKGLPTSPSGLASGEIWRNGNVLNIVP